MCIYTNTYVNTNVNTYVNTCVCIYKHMYIYTKLCIYIYKYILGAICSFSRRIKKPLDNSSETWTDREFRPAEFAGNGNDFPHKSPK